MQLDVLIAQVPAVWDMDANLAALRQVLTGSRPGEVVLLPEGALSGYGDDLVLPDPDRLREVVAAAARLADEHRVHLLCGSLLPGDDGWYNAALYLSPGNPPRVYRKINLAMNERDRLRPGDHLPTFDINGVTAAVQLCREIRFPEQWQHLAASGARFFAYLTNAANPREPAGVWRSHLISRAAENQRFVLAANIPHPDQHCPSLIVSPRGEVLAELPMGRPGTLRHTIDLTETSDWYLEQRRQDVVAVRYRDGGGAAMPVTAGSEPDQVGYLLGQTG
ncbi:carbon-nitrogen hydrolase family protein [Actinoplanes sp. NPDC023801]|uniref:carbon-nitrogen hydrolase family protein n=1 Tax=Actinoplanes sp. NPDC023801 TaxID=3154595 RepID=UPI003404C2BB